MSNNIIEKLDQIIQQVSNYKTLSFVTYDMNNEILSEILYDKIHQTVDFQKFDLIYRKPHMIVFKVIIPENDYIDWHYHNYTEIMTVLQGSCSFETLQGTTYLNEDQTISINPTVPHKFYTEEGCTIQLIITL